MCPRLALIAADNYRHQLLLQTTPQIVYVHIVGRDI